MSSDVVEVSAVSVYFLVSVRRCAPVFEVFFVHDWLKVKIPNTHMAANRVQRLGREALPQAIKRFPIGGTCGLCQNVSHRVCNFHPRQAPVDCALLPYLVMPPNLRGACTIFMCVQEDSCGNVNNTGKEGLEHIGGYCAVPLSNVVVVLVGLCDGYGRYTVGEHTRAQCRQVRKALHSAAHSISLLGRSNFVAVVRFVHNLYGVSSRYRPLKSRNDTNKQNCDIMYINALQAACPKTERSFREVHLLPNYQSYPAANPWHLRMPSVVVLSSRKASQPLAVTIFRCAEYLPNPAHEVVQHLHPDTAISFVSPPLKKIPHRYIPEIRLCRPERTELLVIFSRTLRPRLFPQNHTVDPYGQHHLSSSAKRNETRGR